MAQCLPPTHKPWSSISRTTSNVICYLNIREEETEGSEVLLIKFKIILKYKSPLSKSKYKSLGRLTNSLEDWL